MNLIYIHTNKLNNKSYVGKTKSTLEKRLVLHLNSVKNGSKFPFHRALRKYGIENFISAVLEENISNENIRDRERFWIEEYKSYLCGYNCTKGGEGKDGYITPQSVKDKIRESNLRMTPSGKTVAQEAYKKRTQSILSKNPDGLKDIGLKSGLTQKNNESSKGSNNANSAIIEIYDANDNLIIRCNGNFKEKCKELNLPLRVLNQSYRNNGSKIYSNCKTPKKFITNIYKGWYALKIQKQ